MWQALFSLSCAYYIPTANVVVLYISRFLSYSFAPFIGWLADVRLDDTKLLNLVLYPLFLLAYCTIL